MGDSSFHSPPRAVVLDGFTLNPGDLSWQKLAGLTQLTVYPRTQPADVVTRACEAEILVVNKIVLDEPTVKQLPRLRLVAVTATGVDRIDLSAAEKRGIVVCNGRDYGSDSVAEHVFALLLALCRRPEAHSQAVAAGEWQRRQDFTFWNSPQRELAHLTLGIVGWGRIGQRVGEIAKAFRLKTRIVTRETGGAVPLQDLVEQSDVITLHCPLTEQTRGMIHAKVLSRMKPGSFLINTARGGLIQEDDLVHALIHGPLAAAALDTVQDEPLSATHPLCQLPNCLITPHLAWTTRAARERLLAQTEDNVAAFLAGQPQNICRVR